jgi:hypothetical protein
MKLKLENIEVPLNTIKPFMSKWNACWCGDESCCDGDFEIPIKYPPLEYDGDYFWDEMSYYRFRDTNLTWNYDLYSCGEW